METGHPSTRVVETGLKGRADVEDSDRKEDIKRAHFIKDNYHHHHHHHSLLGQMAAQYNI